MEPAEHLSERLEAANQLTRASARSLRRAPGFTLIAIAILALGIGANTTVFSLIEAALLQPLSFPAPQQLVQVTRDNGGTHQLFVSVPTFRDEQQQTGVFANLAAYDDANFNLAGQGSVPQRVPGEYVTPNFFATLGVHPALGGDLDPKPGMRTAVISDHLWRTRFASDPLLAGRTVNINGVPVAVVGVLPAQFRFPNQPDVFEAFVPERISNDRGESTISTIARLHPGMPLAEAQTQMHALGDRLAREFPKTNAGQTIGLVPLRQQWSGNLRPILLLLFAAVGVVLLIACADLANLLLARAGRRQKEIAVRLALGASRRQIVIQLLTESVFLSLAGAAAGLGIAALALPAILAVSPAAAQFTGSTNLSGTLNLPVLLFTVALALVTGIVFGLAPALQAARADLNATLQQESGRNAGSRVAATLRRSLVIAEIALTLPLLLGAAMLLTSFASLSHVDSGFRSEHALTAHLVLSPARYTTAADITHLNDRLLPKLRAIPGVQAAAMTLVLPFSLCPDFPFSIPGRSFSSADAPDAEWHATTPQTFAALGMTILRGRGLRDADTGASQPIAVINATAARTWWPNQDPVGQSLWIGKGYMEPAFTDAAPRVIVGVVNDVRQDGPNHTAPAAIYFPFSQLSPGFVRVLTVIPVALVVRSPNPPQSLRHAVEAAVWSVDADQPVSDLQPLANITAAALGPQRFDMVLLGLFASLATLLAVLGIYAVMLFAVGERTREIGLRLAIGASPRQLLAMILAQGLRWTLAGIGLGTLAAGALDRALAHQFSALRSVNWLTAVAATALLLAVALAACLVPALRASRTDPCIALRAE